MIHHARNQLFKTLYKQAVIATAIFIVSINQLDAQQKNLFSLSVGVPPNETMPPDVCFVY